MTTRRRFLTILAGAAVLPTLTNAAARWQGIALGAKAQIILDHPNADALIASAVAEISRLEALFSLHQDSQLTRLNAAGTLANPAPEMLELLSICGTINTRTGGAFDPTIQPLWALYAESFAAGSAPTATQIAERNTGWQHVRYSPTEISFAQPDMALTLNGIAQGYIADKVAALFRADGVENVLIDTGEIMALGVAPNGAAWPITIANSNGQIAPLSNAAIATSAPLGTSFDAAATVGHILDPRTGQPGGQWAQVSVTATTAALADGLSTAFCLMSAAEINAAGKTGIYGVLTTGIA
ncbi:MAG TPA: FAD:protein FMN transferase [Rhodobacteraceae bacterium]|nr:FAD:protein FMN transferase [Paracoccaceae bacterium]